MSKILVVDDEMKIRSLYSRLLALENYEVVEAEDTPSAARILARDRGVGLVLLDINLPEVDGGVLYHLIRMYDRRIKVIVTSAYPLEDQQSKILLADDYYDKSQGTEVLLEKIRQALKEEPNEVR